jgi:hypothetical protein
MLMGFYILRKKLLKKYLNPILTINVFTTQTIAE